MEASPDRSPVGSAASGPVLPRRVVFAEDAVGRFGGVETVLRALAPMLQDLGVRTDFLSHEDPAGPAPAPGRVLRLSSVPGESRARSWVRRIRRRRFLRGLAEHDAVVMMNETVAADLLPDLVALRHRRPPGPFVALQFHSRFGSAWRAAGDRTLRRAAEETDALVALDPVEARLFAEHYGRRVASIPNPVATPVADRPRAGRPPELVCVARLAPEKRVDWVMKAFDAVSEEHPDWRLSICGAGPERARIDRLRTELRARERIRFLGEVGPERLVEVYDSAGLLALASSFEGTPMVLAEACARGVPLVCTPSSEYVRRLCEDAGYSSDDSLDSFTEALRSALADSEESWRHRSAAGLAAAREQDTGRVLDQWLTLMGTRDPGSVEHADPR